MELLEKLLIDLHASIESEDLRVDASSLVTNIEAVALAELEPGELEYATYLLFESSSPPSLLVFLTDSSRAKDKDIISAKKHALKFMALYTKLMPGLVGRRGADIIKTLIELFKKETSGEVKSCLLLPVKNILRRSVAGSGAVAGEPAGAMQAEDLQLELVFRVIIEELSQSASKVGKGLRCEGLKTLGLLVAAFPAEQATLQSVDSVLALCEAVLQQNFAKNCKEVDFSAIAGAFSCLDRCLAHFEEKYANSAELWRCLLQAVMATTAADTSRYAASSKAVRLISHHAELFQSLIGLNARQSYDLLAAMHGADKKAMAKHSANALYTALRQIAAYAVQTRGAAGWSDSDAVRTVRALYAQFMAVLENGGAGAEAGERAAALQQEGLMSAVQGLSAIAPAVVAIAGSTITSASGGKALSITGTVLSIIEAARHHARYAEALAGGAPSPAGPKSGTTATAMSASSAAELGGAGEGVEAEAEKDNDAGGGEASGYGGLSQRHRNVLFLTAVVSFVSAVSTQQQVAGAQQESMLVFSTPVVRFLEEYAMEAVVNYSRFWAKQQAQVTQTLCTLAHALQRLHYLNIAPEGGAMMTSFLQCVSSALLVRTVSRRQAGEAANPAQMRLSEFTGQADDRLLFAYADLWRELLSPRDRQVQQLLMRHYEPSYGGHFALRLFEALLEQLLRLLGTLNLDYDLVEGGTGGGGDDGAQGKGGTVVVPRNIADQDVLLNLVAFLEILLPEAAAWFPGRVGAWFPLLAERVVPLAQRLPLLSALYRLLTCVMLTACGEDSASSGVVAPTAGPGVAQLRLLMLELQHRVSTSAGDFQQELLDAVVTLILSAPRSLLSLDDVVVTLRLSLTSGMQALLSVNVITSHLLEDKPSVLPHLPALLPLLDPYLSVGAGLGSAGETNRVFLKSQAAMNRLVRDSKGGKGSGGAGADSASYSAQVQSAVLQLLGRLGGLSQQMLAPAHLTVQDSLVWSDRSCVCLDVPTDANAGTQVHISSGQCSSSH
jgi:hypothetical protein